MQKRSNLTSNLSIDTEVKIGNTLSKEDRDLQKLERILELERLRVDHAKLKKQILDS